jgi:hypothetical protein
LRASTEVGRLWTVLELGHELRSGVDRMASILKDISARTLVEEAVGGLGGGAVWGLGAVHLATGQ